MNKSIFLLLFTLLTPFTSNAESLECRKQAIIFQLVKIKNIGQLHNCQIEIIEENTVNQLKGIKIFAKEEVACDHPDFPCESSIFQIEDPGTCKQSNLNPNGRHLWYGYKYQSEKGLIENFVSLKTNLKGQVLHLTIGQWNTNTMETRNLVACKLWKF